MNICHSCAVVVSGGDTSHVRDCDRYHISAGLEALGLVTVGSPIDGYIRCWLCNWDSMNGYELLEVN